MVHRTLVYKVPLQSMDIISGFSPVKDLGDNPSKLCVDPGIESNIIMMG